jgi:hypothetical protein
VTLFVPRFPAVSPKQLARILPTVAPRREGFIAVAPKRSVRTSMAFTPDEYALLQEVAEELGVSVSVYIRGRLGLPIQGYHRRNDRQTARRVREAVKQTVERKDKRQGKHKLPWKGRPPIPAV